MSSEFAIRPRPPLPPVGENQAKGGPATSPPGKNTASAPQDAKPANLFANPELHFDPAAGLVVLEFRDDTGKITGTIPNQRQLDAYRAHQKTPQANNGPPVTG